MYLGDGRFYGFGFSRVLGQSIRCRRVEGDERERDLTAVVVRNAHHADVAHVRVI